MNVDEFKIDKSDTEKLLGVKSDRKLTFVITSLTSVKKQVEKYLRYIFHGHCEETHTDEHFFHFSF